MFCVCILLFALPPAIPAAHSCVFVPQRVYPHRPAEGPSDEFQVFLNEVQAGNSSDHVREGVEVVGPANTDLTGWTIQRLLVQREGAVQLQMGMQEDDLYAEQLQTRMQEARAGGVFFLGGILDDEGNGFGAKWFDLELEYDLDPIVTKVMYLMDSTGKPRDIVAYSGMKCRSRLHVAAYACMPAQDRSSKSTSARTIPELGATSPRSVKVSVAQSLISHGRKCWGPRPAAVLTTAKRLIL